MAVTVVRDDDVPLMQISNAVFVPLSVTARTRLFQCVKIEKNLTFDLPMSLPGKTQKHNRKNLLFFTRLTVFDRQGAA